ncbi:uncharacterized protein BO88DRAFT_237997 [Aspergillus vadensis CBS 113365]|uniref:Uncharacterized protein n=1 Tax=Aspergillus vadensis (strain CBS 113365 / IMI 142717 / IBT 24658) TaxID=1448311 RepID=A0A319BER7_ASPVC|nr:hypothetical protein BO88DRAFT_237997 [Aspergillus vadensis CBS 113365]PYH71656.1 hypothetical protein BO88DRAFT_237997 [Aspergillus vadensis CBS 113365]
MFICVMGGVYNVFFSFFSILFNLVLQSKHVFVSSIKQYSIKPSTNQHLNKSRTYKTGYIIYQSHLSNTTSITQPS